MHPAKLQCSACGVEKDPAVKEVYPFAADGLVQTPIAPFMMIDCQGTKEWRVATVCHDCFHRLGEVDLWISDRCWKVLNPITPFEQLTAHPTNRGSPFASEHSG